MNLRNWLTLTIRVVDFNLVAKQPDLLAKLRELTLAPHSGLNFELNRMLKDAKERTVNCKVLLAYRFSDLVAWAICSKEDSEFVFCDAENKFRGTNGWLFQVFVKETHRRQGIASELYKTAINLVGSDTLFVCPWDNKSYHFYSTFPDTNRKNL